MIKNIENFDDAVNSMLINVKTVINSIDFDVFPSFKSFVL